MVEVEGAGHTSCTVEMCALHVPVDVAVLDEIQMISHPERGWAWSRALLGLPAAHVHVCGSADALPLLRSLAERCGDELVEHTYERLTPLRVAPSSINGDLSLVRAGDCIVAFSRREIFKLKSAVEAASGLQCGVVYGSLPPSARRKQAQLFNDPATAHDVLVASDAVGMGLNLNIHRVIFASMCKFDGIAVRALEPSEVKQIAGRAGRYHSRYGTNGEVTCMQHSDLPALRRALHAKLPPLSMAGLAPTFEQLQGMQRATRDAMPFAELLRSFEEVARVDASYFCVSLDPMIRAAEVIEGAADQMSLFDLHTFCMAPLDARDGLHATLLRGWARDFAKGRTVRLRYAPPTRPPATHTEMQQLESYFRALDGYLWLAQHFPAAFAHSDKVVTYREAAAGLIEHALEDPPAQQPPRGRTQQTDDERDEAAVHETRPRASKRKGRSRSR